MHLRCIPSTILHIIELYAKTTNTEASNFEKHLVNVQTIPVELTFPANGPDTTKAWIPCHMHDGVKHGPERRSP